MEYANWKPPSREYEEGITAYKHGMSVEDCPYESTFKREQWRSGWYSEESVKYCTMEK